VRDFIFPPDIEGPVILIPPLFVFLQGLFRKPWFKLTEYLERHKRFRFERKLYLERIPLVNAVGDKPSFMPSKTSDIDGI
jgi:hypothetical protein